MRLFFIGYPGEMGGANTEAWHTIRLWRQFGVDVHLIPTWGSDPVWQAKLEPLFSPVETILKGKEGKLPDGAFFQDKDGHVRTEIRTRWYMAPDGHTYRTYALQSDEIACDLALDDAVIAAAAPYPATAKPVFVGHYWLSAQRPELLADNVACLDYSVAKGGFLCAYRWNGERQLSNENFMWAKGGKDST